MKKLSIILCLYLSIFTTAQAQEVVEVFEVNDSATFSIWDYEIHPVAKLQAVLGAYTACRDNGFELCAFHEKTLEKWRDGSLEYPVRYCLDIAPHAECQSKYVSGITLKAIDNLKLVEANSYPIKTMHTINMELDDSNSTLANIKIPPTPYLHEVFHTQFASLMTALYSCMDIDKNDYCVLSTMNYEPKYPTSDFVVEVVVKGYNKKTQH